MCRAFSIILSTYYYDQYSCVPLFLMNSADKLTQITDFRPVAVRFIIQYVSLVYEHISNLHIHYLKKGMLIVNEMTKDLFQR